MTEQEPLPVFNSKDTNMKHSVQTNDFDDLMAMDNDCDLRKKDDDSTVDSSVE